MTEPRKSTKSDQPPVTEGLPSLSEIAAKIIREQTEDLVPRLVQKHSNILKEAVFEELLERFTAEEIAQAIEDKYPRRSYFGSAPVIDGQLRADLASGASNQGSGLVGFVQSGSGATSRTVQDRLREVVSVKDFGAVGDAVTDDTAAIQAAITAHGGKAIYFPAGTYVISSTLEVSVDNTKLYGDGPARTTIRNTHASADAIKFFSSSTASGAFLNNCAIENLRVSRNTAATAGAGIHLIQPFAFILDRIQILDCPEGLKVAGGRLTKLSNFNILVSALLATQTNALLRFKEAPLDGGLYQGCFTVQVSDFVVSGGEVISDCISIESADGLNFVNGYVNQADTNLLKVNVATADEYISDVHFTNVYFDGVTDSTGTTNGVNIPANAVSGASVFDLAFDNCSFANFVGNAILCGEGVHRFKVANSAFLNVTSWAIDFVGSNSDTDLLLTGNQVSNVGNTNSTGGFRISTVRSVTVTNNQFNAINNTSDVALSLIGTNGKGIARDNAFTNCTADLVSTATWSVVPLLRGGNTCDFQTFTPGLTFGGGSTGMTFSAQVGRGVVEGNRFIFSLNITLSAKGSSSGTALVTGLPFTSAAGTQAPMVFFLGGGASATGDTTLLARIVASETTVRLSNWSSGASTVLDDTDFVDTSFFSISGSYEIA